MRYITQCISTTQRKINCARIYLITGIVVLRMGYLTIVNWKYSPGAREIFLCAMGLLYHKQLFWEHDVYNFPPHQVWGKKRSL